MKVKIEIDTKTFVRFWLVVIGFAFVIMAIYDARDALIILGSAFFLALALNAPVSYLASHLPGKSRVWGTAIAYVIVIAILGAIIFVIIPPVARQTVKFIDTVPNLVSSTTGQWQGFIDKYQLQPQVNSVLAAVRSGVSYWTSNIGKNFLSGVGSLVGVIGSLVLVVVLSFLMLIEGPMWLKRLWGVYNDEERMESHRQLAHRMYSVVTGYVTGQLMVSAIGGAIAGISVFILSLFFSEVPADFTLPTIAIAFTLSLIPMFGATVSGIIIALLLASDNITAGIIFMVWFIIYQQIESNLVSPAIQSKKVELSALTVLVSVTTGLYIFGLAGGIISIPIAGCINVLLEEYLANAKKNRSKSEPPIKRLVKKLQGEDI